MTAAGILTRFTTEERAVWQIAVAQAEADGTFFIAQPFHCDKWVAFGWALFLIWMTFIIEVV